MACTPVDMPGSKEEDIIVVGDYAVNKAVGIQPGALGLCFAGRNDVRQPKQLQQLLTVSIHVCRRRLHRSRYPLVRSAQSLRPCDASFSEGN